MKLLCSCQRSQHSNYQSVRNQFEYPRKVKILSQFIFLMTVYILKIKDNYVNQLLNIIQVQLSFPHLLFYKRNILQKIPSCCFFPQFNVNLFAGRIFG